MIAIAGLAFAVLRPQFIAWTSLQSGQDRLDSDPAGARVDLDRCLAHWPNDAKAHFYAALAARMCGDLPAAIHHLDAAARLGWPASEIQFQRAFIQEELREFERRILELTAEFRWPEAEPVVRKWLEYQPDSAKAWRYRAQIEERLRNVEAAIEWLRKAVELEPQELASRFNLARLLLEARKDYEDAATHLEFVLKESPKNSAAAIHLASCREAQGRTGEAVAILDRVLTESPGEARAHYVRGRLELNRAAPGAAATYLRRAAELDPSDEEVLYSLVLALNSVGTKEEIKAAEERWRRSDADLKRVRELGRAIARSPDDLEMRCEIGELFLRNNRDSDGIRWLESALAKQPNHLKSHQLLAEYYERTGNAELAKRHRKAASSEPRSK